MAPQRLGVGFTVGGKCSRRESVSAEAVREMISKGP